MVVVFDERKYCDIDLDAEPCIFLDCGHIIPGTAMDFIIGFEQYERDADGKIISIKSFPKPFWETVIKSCQQCGGSLRNIARYGMIIRQCLLDDSVKKVASWSHSRIMEFERHLIDEQEQLQQSTTSNEYLQRFGGQGVLRISGSSIAQMLTIYDWIGNSRYTAFIELHTSIYKFLHEVIREEQPYALTQHTGQMAGSAVRLEIDQFKFQLRGEIMLRMLLIRCYLIVLGDFLLLKGNVSESHTTVKIKTGDTEKECEQVIRMAERRGYARQEEECRMLLAKFVAMAHQANHNMGIYPPTPENRSFWDAIREDLKETGRWRRCVRGHPFTSQVNGSKCPDCGAPDHGITNE
ncbi:uncharacterized protein GGS25DRAFT_526077 [Hypoxylon fragiforme]|uniref:uncharacterized protein n=1 Tax=Hypoxylon fragiforme TaxID=63214 RepID=UPI0020C5E7F8|nr:uncharacterized protein GGS25DRAFT_526077 [Hypoxylon fragiforme]KAI2603042.1 hypothetical protein GGS25DRAFT_526077 [Hypoxylon fragiforme]